MNNFELMDFESILNNVKLLFPHNMVTNYFKSLSYPHFHLPSLNTLIFLLVFTFFLMKNKSSKRYYEIFEFFFVVEYLTMVYVVL